MGEDGLEEGLEEGLEDGREDDLKVARVGEGSSKVARVGDDGLEVAGDATRDGLRELGSEFHGVFKADVEPS